MPMPSASRFVLRPGWIVDLPRARVDCDDGASVPLTGREVELLTYLLARPGRDVDFEALHRDVWGHGAQVVSRAAQNTVHRLRKKLEVDPKRPDHLVTVHGGAVRLVLAPEVATPAVEAPLGRAELLASVRVALTPGAMVTLSGMGGIGKTTVARAVAQAQGGRWVPLASVSAAEGITSALAAALEVPVHSDEQVGRALASSGTTLVVLDNAEQVLEAVSARLARWTALAPEVAWLITSRARLGVPGERVVMVPPLDVPDGDDAGLRSAAVQLYLARAAPHVGPDQVPEVAALVRDLAGVPLAIELAAARAALLGPAALRERLAHGLRLLRRRGEGRQDAMEAALRWSWSLLSADGRRALVRCAMFRGPFRLEAAEALLEAIDPFPLDLLQELVDASLLAREPGGLTMPALVRVFARAQPSEPSEALAHAHAAVFAAHGAADRELFPWALDADDERAADLRDRELEDVGLALVVCVSSIC